nr:MAG: capsid protein [flactilig virus 4]
MSLDTQGMIATNTAAYNATSTSQMLKMATVSEPNTHTIPDFLERMYKIDSLSWNLADGKGKVLKNYRFPEELLKEPAILAKVRNFRGLHAGVRFIVWVAAQPTQQGMLQISYLPNAKYNEYKSTLYGASYPFTPQSLAKDLSGFVSRSASAATSYINLCNQRLSDTKVSFQNPFVYYDLLTNQGTIGDFQISVASPLKDITASGVVSISVFADFVDIDLEFPTGLPPVVTDAFSDTHAAFQNLSLYRTTSNLNALKSAVNALALSEQRSFQIGNDTSVMSAKLKSLPGMATADSSNMTHVMGIHSNNTLAPTNTGGTGVAEMDITNIVSVPCYFKSFEQSTSQAPITDGKPTNLWYSKVTPLLETDIPDIDGAKSVDYLFYLSSLFTIWRGSIHWNFEIIKTLFHSTTIRVWFCPGATSIENVDRSSCINKVITLDKTTTNFTFTTNFINPFPFMSVDGPNNSVGIIGVDIVNRLISTDALVSKTIEFFVTRKGGSDMQFNLPRSLRYFPYSSTVVQSKRQQSKKHIKENVSPEVILLPKSFQSGPLDQDYQRRRGEDDTYTRPNRVLAASSLTTGNSISNIRELIARSNLIGSVEIIPDPPIPPVPIVQFQDFSLGAPGNIAGSGLLQNVTHNALGTGVASGLVTTLAPLAVVRSSTVSPLMPTNLIYIPKGELVTVSFGVFNAGGTNYPTCQIAYKGDNYDVAWVGPPPNPPMGTRLLRRWWVANSTTFAYVPPVSDVLPTAEEKKILIHIQPHMFSTVAKDSTGTLRQSSLDNLSYFASIYAFARGGVDIKILSEGSYEVVVDPTYSVNTPNTEAFEPVDTSTEEVTELDILKLNNLMTQAINTSVEGFGEVSIPFYSNSYVQSVSPSITTLPGKASDDFQLPLTQLLISPFNASNFKIYRSVNPDYELSYLTGPPLLYPLY